MSLNCSQDSFYLGSDLQLTNQGRHPTLNFVNKATTVCRQSAVDYLKTMSNFILLGICMLAGMILKNVKAFPDKAYLGLNAFIIYISLPAISLRYIPEMELSGQVWYPFLSGWLVLILAVVFFKFISLLLPTDQRTTGCLMMVCGLGNTSFVGYPVVEALYGTAGLKIAVLVDQGTFLALATLGVSLAMIFSTGEVKASVIGRRILGFPPFIAFILALLLSPFSFPNELKIVLEKLGNTLTPLALVSVGLQLTFNFKEVSWASLSLGLCYKLILAPAAIYLLYVVWLGENSLNGQVSVVESAMAPMITASIIASQYELNPPLANLLAGLGIPISLMTVFFWWWLMGGSF